MSTAHCLIPDSDWSTIFSRKASCPSFRGQWVGCAPHTPQQCEFNQTSVSDIARSFIGLVKTQPPRHFSVAAPRVRSDDWKSGEWTSPLSLRPTWAQWNPGSSVRADGRSPKLKCAPINKQLRLGPSTLLISLMPRFIMDLIESSQSQIFLC